MERPSPPLGFAPCWAFGRYDAAEGGAESNEEGARTFRSAPGSPKGWGEVPHPL